ncbi:MAG: SDR family oxidoreductase [Myxococcota bacterium]
MRILMTGGTGRLGSELRSILPNVDAPDRRAMDVTDQANVLDYVRRAAPAVVLHLAAYTDVKGAEAKRQRCWDVNVGGTRHIVRAAQKVGAHLVHVSSDYVFAGDRGGYEEDDPLGPPANHYALTKLVSEEVARVASACLVIRTSFRPRSWPYPTAFTDVYTSQDYVDVIAPLIARAVRHLDRIPYETLHIATERKTIYELARRRSPDVQPATSEQAGVRYPRDVSLSTSRWEALRAAWEPTGAAP